MYRMSRFVEKIEFIESRMSLKNNKKFCTLNV